MLIVLAKNAQQLHEKVSQAKILKVYSRETKSVFNYEDAVWEPGDRPDVLFFASSGKFIRSCGLRCGRDGCAVRILEKLLMPQLVAQGLHGLSQTLKGQLPGETAERPAVVDEFYRRSQVAFDGCPPEQIKLLCDAFRHAYQLTAGIAVNHALHKLRDTWNKQIREPWEVNDYPNFKAGALGVRSEAEYDAFAAVLHMLNDEITLVPPTSAQYSPPANGGYCGGLGFNDSGQAVAHFSAQR